MNNGKNRNEVDIPTEEGRLVIMVTRALFKKDVDSTLRIVGEYLDKHRLQVSVEVINEYEVAGRICDH